MKQGALLKRIKKQATSGVNYGFDDSGGRHATCYLDGLRIPIPRHRVIDEGLAEDIFKECEAKLEEKWWK